MTEHNPSAIRAIEKAMADDRRYAAQNPHRNYWVRRAHFGEWYLDFPSLSSADRRWFTAVNQICFGIRARVFFQQDKNFDTSLTERQAKWVFEFVSGSSK
jgi:hypothetical protein